MNTHQFGENSTYILSSKNSEKLLVRKWNALAKPKGIIIAIHGGMAHSGDWQLPAQFYSERGYELHALDLPGHGTYPKINPGKKNLLDIESFDIYIDHVHALVNSAHNEAPQLPIFIFAHSMGGLIALLYGLGKGKEQHFIHGFGISSPWLKNKTKPPVPLFFVNLFARFFPTLPVPLKIDLGQLTHDQNILERHQADVESGLRGTMATPRFANVSERAQHKLAVELSSWKDFPLAIAIAGADDLADAEFTQTQVQGMQSPVVQYHCYQDNLHENFNELNRQDVFQYLFDSLNM